MHVRMEFIFHISKCRIFSVNFCSSSESRSWQQIWRENTSSRRMEFRNSNIYENNHDVLEMAENGPKIVAKEDYTGGGGTTLLPSP